MRWLGLAVAAYLAAAEPAAWQGEWGQFSRVGDNYRGGRLLLTPCEGDTCQLKISTSTGTGGHASASGTLRLGTGEVALRAGCRLKLALAGDRIEVKAEGEGCGYFIAGDGHLEGTFPLRSRTEFSGDRIEECYIGDSQARMAVCADKALADLHRRSDSLRWQIADREALGNQYKAQKKAWAARLALCDRETDAAACLRGFLEPEIAAVDARLKEWTEASLAPGDPKRAAVLIPGLVGRYTHRFKSGTVDGHEYMATDSLVISRASATAVKFTVKLNFYNGHQCYLEGTAEFKRSGHFVHRQEECVFEIVPGPQRIELRDQDNCRSRSCGARGGYNGAGFDRSSRQATPAPGAPRK